MCQRLFQFCSEIKIPLGGTPPFSNSILNLIYIENTDFHCHEEHSDSKNEIKRFLSNQYSGQNCF